MEQQALPQQLAEASAELEAASPSRGGFRAFTHHVFGFACKGFISFFQSWWARARIQNPLSVVSRIVASRVADFRIVGSRILVSLVMASRAVVFYRGLPYRGLPCRGPLYSLSVRPV